MATGDDFPLRQGTGKAPDGFFFDIENCGGEAEVLGLFLRVSVYIGFFGIGITLNGAMWAPQAIWSRP